MDDLISRQAAIDAVEKNACNTQRIMDAVNNLPPAQPECAKDFVMLKVIDLNGRPYYSIIYLENGNEFEGYSSYDLMVISEYLKRYFGFAQPEIIRCRECKLRDTEYCNMAHDFMGMKDDDFCSYAERREVSE